MFIHKTALSHPQIGLRQNSHLRCHGFTLVEVMIAIMIIGLLAGMLMPNFESARVESQTNACVNNLRVINAGKTSAAFELSLSTGMSVPEADLLKYLGGDGVAPVCPANGTYTYNPIGTTATCTIADHVYLTN